HDADNVPQQRRMRVIDLVRDAALIRDCRKLRRARQRHFNRARTVLVQIRQLMPGQWPHLLQFRRHHPRDSERSALCLTRLPGPGQRIAEVEAVHSVGEIAHEIPPPQFAVGKNLETQLVLFRQNARDVAIFQFMQPLRVFSVAPRLQQLRRPQKASHMIGPILLCHHFSPRRKSATHACYLLLSSTKSRPRSAASATKNPIFGCSGAKSTDSPFCRSACEVIGPIEPTTMRRNARRRDSSTCMSAAMRKRCCTCTEVVKKAKSIRPFTMASTLSRSGPVSAGSAHS